MLNFNKKHQNIFQGHGAIITFPLTIKIVLQGGNWVAQWVKASAFASGHDPSILGSSPAWGPLLSREPASSSPSACLSACL